MAAQCELRRPDEVAMKVMRRAQVSKMTRALQDRLALANVKIQNGWENMSLEAIEPQIEERMRRKRPASSNDTISDTASTTSSRLHSSSGLDSSPLTAPMFSDDYTRSASPSKRRARRTVQKMHSSGAATGRRPRITTSQASWKKHNDLAQSSPIKHARFRSNHISFVSEADTVPDSPPSPDHSEEDDADLPVHSFKIAASTRITSSPPHTPPPDRRMRRAHLHNVSWSRTPRSGDDGADLLMFLATSPSPANAATLRQRDIKPVIQAPSTPPPKSTPLPSSHMTPGTNGAGILGFGPQTPGTNFNFADFVNVTPSPAQGHWQRTPIAGRTPAAARDSAARRKLNFDALLPPSTSPTITRGHSSGNEELSMQLGGELVP